ncbi:PhyR family response regulator anti-anti-sigma factor [Methylopila sp. Yamaguchi]|uniref:PhyR family response regulator anti-anti-sigma factor n=1 Tax=Methylopila sp. Yamaguchi TaxID=1437817 RepID=UPI000CCC77D3|nr:response regulator [Methylopila sp. Yamaguchi]
MNRDELFSKLPFVRRHARMLLGRQDDGDRLVAHALQRLIGAISPRDRFDPWDVLLFQALYESLERQGAPPRWTPEETSTRERIADQRLQAIPLAARAVLLLTAVEGFSEAATAVILGMSHLEVRHLADDAQRVIERDLQTTVLIIEDEWPIARHLRQIVNTLGHDVVAIAGTQRDAVDLAARHHPGLVIADIKLADGSSGADAASSILLDRATPVVFVTAHPGDLLRSRRNDTTYLITKPFSPAMIKTTISQALFFS